ncbi:hypothetical protein IAT38_005059 [Cryptococcus sp. DSM 104549]
MSYFSDTSSCSSALPLTPSSTHHPSPPPAHPVPGVASTPDAPVPYLTPPPSLRLYSHALKARMAQGMTAAMRELKDDRGGPERQLDAEYGYDEDPIERHVKLHLTPRTEPPRRPPRPKHGLSVMGLAPQGGSPKSAGVAGGAGGRLHVTMDDGGAEMLAVSGVMMGADVDDVDMEETPRTKQTPAFPASSSSSYPSTHNTEMLVSSPSPLHSYLPLEDLPSPLASTTIATATTAAAVHRSSFVPGLIQFHRSSSLLAAPGRPDAARMDSNGSTASMQSEASFEAVKAEDMVSLYGGAGPSAAVGASAGVRRAEGPFVVHDMNVDWDMSPSTTSTDLADPRASLISEATLRPTKTPKLGPASSIHFSLPSPCNHADLHSLHQRPPTPYTSLLPSALAATPPPLPPVPTLKGVGARSPGVRRRPAPPATLGTASDDGGRPTGEASALGFGSGTPRGGAGSGDGEPAWLKERTLSEKMVAQAGLRCQRQRAGVRRR